MGRKPKTKSDSKPKKVSEEDESQPQEEIWDVVRVIEKNEECVCGTDGCEEPAVATWACNLDPEDKWDTCEGCQLKDFGGWPEGIDPPDDDEQETSQDSSSSTNEETPSHDREAETLQANEAFTPQGDTEASAGDDQQVETLMTVDVPVVEALDPSTTKPQENDDTASNNPSTETNAVETSSPKTDTDPEDDGEEIEVWELKKILSYADITKEATIKCSTETCTLPACSVWISNLAPTEKWYSCLDCQENDFEGWPALEELPVKRIETNHLEAIANKCSKQKSPQMPNFPSTSTTPARKQSNDVANFVTPPPNSLASMAPLQAKEGTGTGTGTATNAAKITPNPSANPVPNKPVSAGALASYKKWQQQAEALGGGRIVVSQPAAKKIIFDFLFDAFCPMNITQIFQVRRTVLKELLSIRCVPV